MFMQKVENKTKAGNKFFIFLNNHSIKKLTFLRQVCFSWNICPRPYRNGTSNWQKSVFHSMQILFSYTFYVTNLYFENNFSGGFLAKFIITMVFLLRKNIFDVHITRICLTKTNKNSFKHFFNKCITFI
jgi:hypothetical protein